MCVYEGEKSEGRSEERESILVGGPETNDGVFTYYFFPRKSWNHVQRGCV